ncbi:hypothetical protein ACP8HZ_02925 [Francisella noatunensis]
MQSALGSQVPQITGLNQKEANNLALMIKSGASLGKDNIKKVCYLLW